MKQQSSIASSTGGVGVSRALLLDIATRSSLDDASLSTVCAMRPDTVSVISHQVLYIAAILSQLRACHHASNRKLRVRDLLLAQKPEARRPKGIIAATPSQLRIVIIGGGTVGRHIASSMLTSGMFHSSALSIITRQPATLRGLSEKGVRCFPQDDVDVLRSADLVVLAVQPSQIYAVGKRFSNSSHSSSNSGANSHINNHNVGSGEIASWKVRITTIQDVSFNETPSSCRFAAESQLTRSVARCSMTTALQRTLRSIAAAVRKMAEEAGDQEQQVRATLRQEEGLLQRGGALPSDHSNIGIGGGGEKRKQTLLELAFPRDGAWVSRLTSSPSAAAVAGTSAVSYGGGQQYDGGDEVYDHHQQMLIGNDDTYDDEYTVGGTERTAGAAGSSRTQSSITAGATTNAAAEFHDDGASSVGEMEVRRRHHDDDEENEDEDDLTERGHVDRADAGDDTTTPTASRQLQRQHKQHHPQQQQQQYYPQQQQKQHHLLGCSSGDGIASDDHHQRPQATFYFLDRFLWCLMQTQQATSTTSTSTAASLLGGGGTAAMTTSKPSASHHGLDEQQQPPTTTSLAMLETLITTWALLLPEGPLRKRMLDTCDAAEIQRALMSAAAVAVAAATGKPSSPTTTSSSHTGGGHDDAFQRLVATVLSVSELPHGHGRGSDNRHHHHHHRGNTSSSTVVMEAVPTVQWCSAVLLREDNPFVVVDELQKQFLRLLW
ncbi:Hypothetical protein, putative [Bodo saltans]|uniref:Pyrroline-5-carboxylate reductase catalytic N-terminal domain-containing protein n=1 Tax=Bodo saltans TaxID=75058 RepID=A0A0S4IXV2_BODSA|nr:Hypothetical protein, putative [Bodo saltans]|eukprot:CUG06808.1 Hypothetical protein, putative [Bodo saltans]